MKFYIAKIPASQNTSSHNKYYSFIPTSYSDKILGTIEKIEGNWNNYRYICKKVNKSNQESNSITFNIIFDTNNNDINKVKPSLLHFFNEIDNYKPIIYNEFSKIYKDLLHNHTIYSGNNTWGYEIDDEMKKELIVENFEDFVKKIYTIDLVIEEYEEDFLYYFHIYIWDGEYFFEKRSNANLLFVFRNEKCIYKGFDIENLSFLKNSMVDFNSNFLNKFKIIRQIKNYLSKTDKTKFNKDFLLKTNLLFNKEPYSFIPVSLTDDRLIYKTKKNKDDILFKELDIEKLIDYLILKKDISKLLKKTIIFETDNELFVVKKDKFYGDVMVYENRSYSEKIKSEISVFIFTEIKIDNNFLKETIIKSRQLYEKHNNSILTAIADYYIETYFDKNSYNNGLFNEIFLEENYPIIVKNKDIKRLITIPNIWIENLSDIENNILTIKFETKFDKEHGLQVEIEDDKIKYVSIQY